jgi:hypothetical protein
LPGFNPDNIQPWTVSVVVSMTILALTSVGVRLISRRIKGQPLWWDDYMILFSMVRIRVTMEKYDDESLTERRDGTSLSWALSSPCMCVAWVSTQTSLIQQTS